jgi:hypothetical protein
MNQKLSLPQGLTHGPKIFPTPKYFYQDFKKYFILLYRDVFVLLAIVLSVLIRFTDSDYPFGIFRLFLTRFTILLKKKKEEEIC